MLIRRANLEDSNAISNLIIPLARKFITHEFSEQGQEHLIRSLSASALYEYIEQGFRYYVAEDPGIVGVIATRDDSHLYHLFVEEVAQGQGVASQLWETARIACKEKGSFGIFTVNSSRHAVGFYENLGFEFVEERIENGVVSVHMRFVEGAT